MLESIKLICFAITVACVCSRSVNSKDNAIITLVTGKNSGYEYGAVSLGESLKLVGSKASRIAMVTPEVDETARQLMQANWKVVDIPTIKCVQKASSDVSIPKDEASLHQDFIRWSSACSKFHAWNFVEFHRVIFMDSDTIVLHNIDDAFYTYSNASMAAAPEIFPPDTFNAGFMVLTPSKKVFKYIVDANTRYGSLEGGDQGVLNRYLCPDWYTVNDDNKDCGRIPWRYNVESQLYQLYKVYLAGYSDGRMNVIHFTNDGKPWKSLLFDYQLDQHPVIPEFFQSLQTPNYIPSHLYWRYCFLRSSGYPIPPRSIFYDSWEEVTQRRGIFRNLPERLFDETMVTGVVERNLGQDRSHSNRNSKPQSANRLDTTPKLSSKRSGERARVAVDVKGAAEEEGVESRQPRADKSSPSSSSNSKNKSKSKRREDSSTSANKKGQKKSAGSKKRPKKSKK